MPDQELEELYKELSKKKPENPASDPAFAKYLESMDALYAEVKKLYAPDRQGLPPLLDAKRLDSLRAKYDEAAKAVEGYIGDDKSVSELPPDKQATRNLAKRVNALMSHDMTALLQYENQLKWQEKPVPESLPTIIERARSYTIDMSEAQVSMTGSAMSQRMPLEMTLNGQTIRGMFTKKNSLDCSADYKEMIEDLKTRCSNQQAKDALDNLLPEFRSYYPRLNSRLRKLFPLKDNSAEDAFTLATLVHTLEGNKEGMGKELLTKLMGETMNLPPNKVSGALGRSSLNTMVDKLRKIGGKHYTHDKSGIAQKSRLDDRNSAMSKVAVLLGVPGVICNAVPMRFKDEKGKIIEGTFMEMADGVDPLHPTGLYGEPDERGAFGKHPRVVRDLANLQMLDYICGNTDRHAGNMIFSFDNGNPPKVTGVKGIDNDLSFGARTHENGMSHLAPLKEMRVVSASMAQRIEALTPAQLKFALREFSLSEKELDAAGARLERVQKMLALSRETYKDKAPITANGPEKFVPGVVRIVPDQEFKHLNIDELCGTNQKSFIGKMKDFGKAVENVFNKAINNIKRICTNIGLGSAEVVPLAEVTSANRATRESAEAQQKAADIFAKRMDKAVGKQPDAETEKLAESVKRYQRYQNELAERLKLDPNDPNNCFDAVIGANDLFRMKQLLGEMSDSAHAFLERDNVPDSKLKQLAKDIQNYSDKLSKVPEKVEQEERQTVMANDRQAMERFNRRMSKQFNDAANSNDGAAAPS